MIESQINYTSYISEQIIDTNSYRNLLYNFEKKLKINNKWT